MNFVPANMKIYTILTNKAPKECVLAWEQKLCVSNQILSPRTIFVCFCTPHKMQIRETEQNTRLAKTARFRVGVYQNGHTMWPLNVPLLFGPSQDAGIKYCNVRRRSLK